MKIKIDTNEFYIQPKKYKGLINVEMWIDTDTLDPPTKKRIKNALKKGHYSASRRGRVGAGLKALIHHYNLPFIFQTRGERYGGMLWVNFNDTKEWREKAHALLNVGVQGNLQTTTYSRFEGEWWYTQRPYSRAPDNPALALIRQRQAREEEARQFREHSYKVFQAIRHQYYKEMPKELKQRLKEISDQL